MSKFIRIYLTIIVITIASSYGYAQSISFRKKQSNLKELFNEIRKQTGFQIFVRSEILEDTGSFPVNFNNEPMENILRTVLKDQGLDYSIEGKEIIINRRDQTVYNMVTVYSEPIKSKKQNVSKTIAGKVTDTLNRPLPGVSVKTEIKGNATVTNENGLYSLTIPDNAGTLEFSYVGMLSQKISIKGQSPINVILKDDSNLLKEMVITGYGGSTTLKNNPDATTKVDMKLLEENPSANLIEVIQGQVPGMMTMMGTGEPGEEPMVILRGVSSLTGNLAPLVVINEVPMDETFRLSSINPNDIISLDVLKGASAISIYGSRGAAGVFMIRTRTGLTSAPNITYRMNYGLDKLMRSLEVLNASEFKMLLAESITNRIRDENDYGNGAPINFNTHTYYNSFFNSGYFGEAETNWMDVLYQDGTKINHNLNIAGRSGELGYNIGLGLNDTKGQIKKTGSDRKNIDIRIDSRQNKRVQFALTANGYQQEVKQPVGNLSDALLMRPDMSPYNADGTIFIPAATTGYRNPLVDLEGIDRATKIFNYTLAANAQVKLMEGLKWKKLLLGIMAKSLIIDMFRWKLWTCIDIYGSKNIPHFDPNKVNTIPET